MKIIIHSLDELLQLSELVAFGKVPREVVQLQPSPAQEAKLRDMLAEHRQRDVEGTQRQLSEGLISVQMATDKLAELGALPTDIEPPAIMSDEEVEARIAAHSRSAPADGAQSVDTAAADADGAPYSTDWHSDPAKLTAKGLWRARRGRDEDAYKAWLLEQAVEVAEAAIASDEAETVATETHALPQDEVREGPGATEPPPPPPTEPESDPRDGSAVARGALPGATVDLEALIAASQEAALDASDSHVDLLNACRNFTSEHGHLAFTALKAAVAPDGDSGQGKTVQHLTPGERRLMQACIANYPSKEA